MPGYPGVPAGGQQEERRDFTSSLFSSPGGTGSYTPVWFVGPRGHLHYITRDPTAPKTFSHHHRESLDSYHTPPHTLMDISTHPRSLWQGLPQGYVGFPPSLCLPGPRSPVGLTQACPGAPKAGERKSKWTPGWGPCPVPSRDTGQASKVMEEDGGGGGGQRWRERMQLLENC